MNHDLEGLGTRFEQDNGVERGLCVRDASPYMILQLPAGCSWV